MMPSDKTDIVQSFRLHFWREPTQSEFLNWRGKIWHEQQKPGDEPASVANLEDAFEMIRRVLHSGASISASALRENRASRNALNCMPARVVQAICPLVSFWRRLWGRRS
jgi:hypothetical protein